MSRVRISFPAPQQKDKSLTCPFAVERETSTRRTRKFACRLHIAIDIRRGSRKIAETILRTETALSRYIYFVVASSRDRASRACEGICRRAPAQKQRSCFCARETALSRLRLSLFVCDGRRVVANSPVRVTEQSLIAGEYAEGLPCKSNAVVFAQGKRHYLVSRSAGYFRTRSSQKKHRPSPARLCRALWRRGTAVASAVDEGIFFN